MNILNLIHKSKSHVIAILRILKKEKGIKNKIVLFLIYIKLTCKDIFLVTLLGIELKKEVIFGYEVHFFSYETFLYLFNQIFISKEYSLKLSQNPFIIDCGSNIGMSVLFFKQIYPNSRILCFEPDKKAFQILKSNIEHNKIDNISLNEAAVYNKEGEINYYSDRNLDGSLGMGVSPHYLEQWGRKSERHIVSSVMLSTYIDEPVDLLKLDIEGAEEKVIEELSENQKLRLIKEMIIDYHYSKSDSENKLGKILWLLEKNDFKFIINCPFGPPYFIYRDKPYYMSIYAYR